MNNLCLRDQAFIAAYIQTIVIITGCKFSIFPPQYYTDSLIVGVDYDLV